MLLSSVIYCWLLCVLNSLFVLRAHLLCSCTLSNRWNLASCAGTMILSVVLCQFIVYDWLRFAIQANPSSGVVQTCYLIITCTTLTLISPSILYQLVLLLGEQDHSHRSMIPCYSHLFRRPAAITAGTGSIGSDTMGTENTYLAQLFREEPCYRTQKWCSAPKIKIVLHFLHNRWTLNLTKNYL